MDHAGIPSLSHLQAHGDNATTVTISAPWVLPAQVIPASPNGPEGTPFRRGQTTAPRAMI